MRWPEDWHVLLQACPGALGWGLEKGSRVRYGVSGPTSVGAGIVRGDEIELSRLIDILDERSRAWFKPSDQQSFRLIRKDAVTDSGLRQAAFANTTGNSGYVFRKALQGLFIDRKEQNEGIAAKFVNEPASTSSERSTRKRGRRPKMQIRPPDTQRIQTLRLRGAKPEDPSWKNSLW